MYVKQRCLLSGEDKAHSCLYDILFYKRCTLDCKCYVLTENYQNWNYRIIALDQEAAIVRFIWQLIALLREPE